jgi:hypothetical protein
MHPIEHLKVHSRCNAAENLGKTSRAFRNRCPLFPIVWGENRSECQQVKEMQLSWRQLQHELYNARDATLMLAVIAGFAAWIITQLLRAVLG